MNYHFCEKYEYKYFHDEINRYIIKIQAPMHNANDKIENKTIKKTKTMIYNSPQSSLNVAASKIIGYFFS